MRAKGWRLRAEVVLRETELHRTNWCMTSVQPCHLDGRRSALTVVPTDSSRWEPKQPITKASWRRDAGAGRVSAAWRLVGGWRPGTMPDCQSPTQAVGGPRDPAQRTMRAEEYQHGPLSLNRQMTISASSLSLSSDKNHLAGKVTVQWTWDFVVLPEAPIARKEALK